jgi:CubicO group peptidase (beta-lactamase class C family)
MAKVYGKCEPGFETVRGLLQENISSGSELGASIYVNIGGRTALDIWGGYSDSTRSEPWGEDTITCVFSTSKTITALAALILVDRGQLDLRAKVSEYWPEFAANGKEDIEVRHLLSHTSGLAGWDTPISMDEIYDTAYSTSRLAAQAPWWKPGSASGYHAITQGQLVGELVKRLTGKSLRRFIADEMAGPIGADYQLGVSEGDWPRTAEIIPAGLPLRPNSDPESVASKTIRGLPIKAEDANTPAFRTAELGASNGFGNARGIGRLVSMVALGGEVDGVRFISPETIDLIFEEQAKGVDLVIQEPYCWGLGFALPRADTAGSEFMPHEGVCYWGGWGGSTIIADVKRQVTICYVMNKLGEDLDSTERTDGYVQAIYEALERGAGNI